MDRGSMQISRGLEYNRNTLDSLSLEDYTNGIVRFKIMPIDNSSKEELVIGWADENTKKKYLDPKNTDDIDVILCSDSEIFSGILFYGTKVKISKIDGLFVLSSEWVKEKILNTDWYRKCTDATKCYWIDSIYPEFPCNTRISSRLPIKYGVLEKYAGIPFDRDTMDDIICDIIKKHPYIPGVISLKIAIKQTRRGVDSYYHILIMNNDNYASQEISNTIVYEKE